MGCMCARTSEAVANRVPAVGAAGDQKQAANAVAIVTGASAGIGKYTVKILFEHGYTVILAGRTRQRLEDAADEIARSHPNLDKTKLRVMVVDTSSLESVRNFAKDFLALNLPLKLLVNNAGTMMVPFGLTPEGFEIQLATNHLGHFLLTELLIPKLKESAPSRIVCVASEGHKLGTVDLKNLNWTPEAYSPIRAYGRSKLCNILHARALADRLKDTGVTAYSLHPGVIATELSRNNCSAKCFYGLCGCFMINVSQGAATTVYCCLEPGIEKYSGRYFKDTGVSRGTKDAEDGELAGKLYELSLQLVGLKAASYGAADSKNQG